MTTRQCFVSVTVTSSPTQEKDVARGFSLRWVAATCLPAPRGSWDARADPAMPAGWVSAVSRAVQSAWHRLAESRS